MNESSNKPQFRNERGLLEKFGNNLRQVREGKGLSQERLANMAGIAQSSIYRAEKGKINMTVATVMRLAEVLEIPYKDLFDFE